MRPSLGSRLLQLLLSLLCADVTAVIGWPDAIRLGVTIRPGDPVHTDDGIVELR